MTSYLLTNQVPKEPTVRRAWIVFQLRIRGLSFRELARRHGVTTSAFSHATLTPSHQLEEILAESLGLKVEELFPERYDATGRRLFNVRVKSSTARKSGNVYRRGAA